MDTKTKQVKNLNTTGFQIATPDGCYHHSFKEAYDCPKCKQLVEKIYGKRLAN